MRKTKKSIINNLAKLSAKGELVSNMRLAAGLVLKGKIIAVGTNQNKTHPIMTKYCKHPEANLLHAEVDTLLKGRKILGDDLSSTDLYIVRTRKDLSLGLARPCAGCSKMLRDYKIRSVFYTNNKGIFNETTPKDLCSFWDQQLSTLCSC